MSQPQRSDPVKRGRGGDAIPNAHTVEGNPLQLSRVGMDEHKERVAALEANIVELQGHIKELEGRCRNEISGIRQQISSCRNEISSYNNRITALLQSSGAASRAPLRFMECGTWPTAHPPPTSPVLPAPPVFFLATTAGEWCFEPDTPLRMVRVAEYVLLWKRLSELVAIEGSKRKGLLIKGHPGIGKTLLLDVLLSWSLHERPQMPVLTIGVGRCYLFATVGGEKRRFQVRSRKDVFPFVSEELLAMGIPKGAQILVLHDVKTVSSLRYQIRLVDDLCEVFSVTCVLASSPMESNYKDFVKTMSKPCAHFVLPTLSYDEVAIFLRHTNPTLTESDIIDRFDKVGGVLRNLVDLEYVNGSAEIQLQALPTLKFDIGTTPSSSASDCDTNKVVQLIPNANRVRTATFDFVSDQARRLFIMHGDREQVHRQWVRLHEAKCDASRDALGRFFGEWFISALQHSTAPLSVRKLVPRPMPLVKQSKKQPKKLAMGPPVIEHWVVPPAMSVVRFPGNDPSRIVAPTGGNALLYVPRSEQFPVVDAAIVDPQKQCTLLLVTLQDHHCRSCQAASTLLTALAHNGITVTRLVWVVDMSSPLKTVQSVLGGSLQEYDDIPQYVCRIDEYMALVKTPTNETFSIPVASTTPSGDDLLGQIQKFVDPSASVLRAFKDIGTAVTYK